MVNHSENFENPNDPACHTNTIEGTWRCIKRWLPSSERYSLEDYLPMYLWFNHHKKVGKSSFWSLINILSKNMKSAELESDDEAEPNHTEPVAKKQKIQREAVSCALCGKQCLGIGGLKRHLHYCSNNPNTQN